MRALAVVLALLAPSALLAACATVHGSEQTGDLRLTLVHSNDTMGKLEPCG